MIAAAGAGQPAGGDRWLQVTSPGRQGLPVPGVTDLEIRRRCPPAGHFKYSDLILQRCNLNS
jgi:hypothetical protein